MKNYTSAPLPFMGQKRRFLRDFRAALEKYPCDGLYVDLFGGSGLLAHTAKRLYPQARVIYNDYDNYESRIRNVPRTNTLLEEIRVLTHGLDRDKIIKDPQRHLILSRIKEEPGFVDYITLSSSLLFSMNYAASYEAMAKETLYNVVRKSSYSADGYLDGLEIVRVDYKVLFDKYKDADHVVFLIDPPYLSTECGTYNNYWRLSDYLDVLDTLGAGSYFYFTSNKSNILELCEWMASKSYGGNPFAGAEVTKVVANVNYSSTYTDIMLHKGWSRTVG